MSCSQKPSFNELTKYSESKALLGTFVGIDVCHDGTRESEIQETLAVIWEFIGEIHWRMSIYTNKGDVYNVNRSFANPVVIQADTYHLIEKSKRYSQLTLGAFDITVSPLIDLWRNAGKKNKIPPPEEVKKVKRSIGVDHIKLLENQRVHLDHSETKIDLGGIAKGYAVDQAAQILRENGFFSYFIDAGGDIYAGGRNCKNQPWRIGIRDPQNKDKILEILHVENAAVTTSGKYEQYFEIQGNRYSHIINPITGYPQQQVTSATVVAPLAADADALSTALSVLSPVKSVELINSFGNQYAAYIVVLSPEKRYVHKSSQMVKILQSKNYEKK